MHHVITAEDSDILGEIGNINMGTAATTLSAMLNQKVLITTPKVSVLTWKQLYQSYDNLAVGVRVGYKNGLNGSNVLILKVRDVKIVADLMMGGTGDVKSDFQLNDMEMSAIGEAMNQMVGSASTSLSAMINRKIDIEIPQPFLMDFTTEETIAKIGLAPSENIVNIAFRMEVSNLIDSQIMQIFPMAYARELVVTLKDYNGIDKKGV
ncbi:MAG: flagellar motor switch phosphatase FliY [Defluviitaleaceae bacterium]|nr:flagellar motor switch phosphatase FliY [Defluviitaleaceae bacterium]